ncbi:MULTISPECIES: 3-isopropylmalate dehydrogenase [Psychrilyobacter]|uniref:3-isopropylmalate dehydrogenase n=1 Tax=Psychrilyobacter piezotolerans TaxID=2293438 RepID=A0ABX9KL83_9FUSO|nr:MULTISPECIES: 3-isopropylmalate dehydrogenase [Psychrilyobacter]MCS5420514.1 3-isopropylmalate dehydrogenase [Psychrilyobacter sp. S5]NDI76898.1 3-isopropylmalate dehydrogenase [Psychrilyobacter piezotolerans]RDE65176.1 3-isopropylmalate dehydrogenase [Psychrilyobacter sp. S5]REI42746.1 3-isopropylmalate dehydrogenase [Psychrilyobacter piezotolerans]
MEYRVTVMPGDGIGREIVEGAVKVIKKIEEKYNHKFNINYADIGGIAIDNHGTPLPEETIEMCKNSDGIILGAVGGPKWDSLKGEDRPERGLLNIRKELGLYTNLRPAIVYEPLKNASPLKPEIIGEGLDICIVRELTGGIYFGEKGVKEDGTAYDVLSYNEEEVKRIAVKGFETAMKRGKKLTSVDKSNVLESSRLWRRVVIEVSKDYPEVELNHMYVDNAAMQLLINPTQFDVILTMNMFGDILSDEASMITGSIGMLPSASIGEKYGLYEPIHGSAPDIAGQDIANPIATILSAAMMFKHSMGLPEEGTAIEKAVEKVLNDGIRTRDIHTDSTKLVGTEEMVSLIVKNI